MHIRKRSKTALRVATTATVRELVDVYGVQANPGAGATINISALN